MRKGMIPVMSSDASLNGTCTPNMLRGRGSNRERTKGFTANGER